MIKRIATSCALILAAIGCGSDPAPVKDPSTTSSDPTSPAWDPSTAGAATETRTSPTTTGAEFAGTPTSPRTDTQARRPAPAGGTVPTTTDPAAPPSNEPQSPNVVNNPGVADQSKTADNTKINDRDRHGALTPIDQGNSAPELKITATIRKGMMGDKGLSFTAKNVKVITVGTKVTLRGPVKSQEEKNAIEALAKKTEGVQTVDNQLEIKK